MTPTPQPPTRICATHPSDETNRLQRRHRQPRSDWHTNHRTRQLSLTSPRPPGTTVLPSRDSRTPLSVLDTDSHGGSPPTHCRINQSLRAPSRYGAAERIPPIPDSEPIVSQLMGSSTPRVPTEKILQCSRQRPTFCPPRSLQACAPADSIAAASGPLVAGLAGWIIVQPREQEARVRRPPSLSHQRADRPHLRTTGTDA